MRIIKYIFCAILFVGVAFAENITINWMNGNTTYAQTTCTVGGDIILPETPTKRGYTFMGWNTMKVYSDGVKLPVEYDRLEYIESSGTQWIDLGTLFSGSVEVRISPTRLTGRADGLDYDGILGISYNPQLGWYTTGWTTGIAGSSLPYPPEIGKIYTYKWTASDGKSYIDGVSTGLSRKGILTLKLFYCADNPKFSKCYEYKQYDNNDVLQINLIPVRRLSDDAIGMFDRVNNKFYGNNGTGEFIAGPVINEL